MSWLTKQFGDRAARVIPFAVLLIVVIAGFGVSQCVARKNAKTEATITRNQGDAAVKSGAAAIDTLSNRFGADAEGDHTVQETQHEISNAQDAGAVTNAGRNGLCRLAGYRTRPECVQ